MVVDVFSIDGRGELFERLAGGDSQQVPGVMREPLLGPSPICIFPRLGVRKIEVDIVLVVETRGNAVDDAAGRIGVFEGAEEAIGRVVMTGALHQAGIVRVETQYPVELVEREGLKG